MKNLIEESIAEIKEWNRQPGQAEINKQIAEAVFNAPVKDEMRAAFEQWFDPEGRGLERNARGEYKFMTAYTAWGAFQAGWEACLKNQNEERE